MSFFFPIDSTLARLADLEDEFWGPQGSRQRNTKELQHKGGASHGSVRPRMDWVQTGDKTVLTVELPGVDKKNVDISLHDNVLTISGSTSSNTEEKHDGYLVQERRFGSFSRSIAVPNGLSESEIKASMDNGVLKLEMPKAAKESEQKKITIS
ncbi:hypothetical protein OIO90_000642 [Microbotryomycetes sp. JL221]|nr:hypothetical protein OIO90_000642 [Microbotryomycetes sp. JL221]